MASANWVGTAWIKACLPILGIYFAVSPCTATEPAPDSAAIRTEILQIGPRAAIEDMDRSGAWEALITLIGAGKKQYIALIPLLAPGSDAGWSEELVIGLAEALPHNPRAVLRMLADHPVSWIDAKSVCGIPFIEMNAEDVKRYRRAAMASVTEVYEPSLSGPRADCLVALAPRP